MSDYCFANDQSELCIAVNAHDTNLVKDLIADGVDVNEISGVNECTALKFAAVKGFVDMMEILFLNGADVNIVYLDGETALLYAAKNGHVEATRLLLKKGALVQIQTTYFTTILSTTISNNYVPTANGNKEVIVKLLIAYGADIEAQNHQLQSCMMLAIQSGKHEILRILVDEIKLMNDRRCKSDIINATDMNGQTALHYAVQYQDIHSLQTLLLAGCSTNIENHEHKIPIEVTKISYNGGARCGREMILRLFEDVQEAVRIKTLEHVVALSAHERARKAGTPISLLNLDVLSHILGRGKRGQMTEHEKFIDDVARLQLRGGRITAERALYPGEKMYTR
jgi:ankyrin repeat protein